MMSMPRPSEPRGARHAALLLHAMAPADRNWMLDVLPHQERAALVPLLAELEALGIERDSALIDAATSGEEFAAPAALQANEVVSGMPHSAVRPDEAMLRSLDAEQVSVLAGLLWIEPAGLIAEFLGVADWPWHEALLEAMGPMQRRKIEAHLATMGTAASMPPGLRAALISMVVARLRGRPMDGTPASTPWRKLRHSFVSAFRGGWLQGRSQ